MGDCVESLAAILLLNGCNNLLSNITIDFVWQAQGFQVSLGMLSFEMFWK